jgi:hypothetical protein
MQALWSRRYEVGNLNPSKDYWTSTEYEWDRAVLIDWETGTPYARDKNNRVSVRAIRKFDDTVVSTVVTYAPAETNIVFTAPEEVSVIDGILSFRMKTSKAWINNSILLIETYKGAVKTGHCAISAANELFGFDVSATDGYQLLAIPYSNFILTQTKFDAFKFSLTGSWPNGFHLLLDSIVFQYTTIIPTIEQGVVLQVQDQVLEVAEWEEYGAVFRYTFKNAKITDHSQVDITPHNEDIEIVLDAFPMPETISSAGQVEIIAKNVPSANIRITVDITEVVL